MIDRERARVHLTTWPRGVCYHVTLVVKIRVGDDIWPQIEILRVIHLNYKSKHFRFKDFSQNGSKLRFVSKKIGTDQIEHWNMFKKTNKNTTDGGYWYCGNTQLWFSKSKHLILLFGVHFKSNLEFLHDSACPALWNDFNRSHLIVTAQHWLHSVYADFSLPQTANVLLNNVKSKMNAIDYHLKPKLI